MFRDQLQLMAIVSYELTDLTLNSSLRGFSIFDYTAIEIRMCHSAGGPLPSHD